MPWPVCLGVKWPCCQCFLMGFLGTVLGESLAPSAVPERWMWVSWVVLAESAHAGMVAFSEGMLKAGELWGFGVGRLYPWLSA